jgi:hypothetical protein
MQSHKPQDKMTKCQDVQIYGESDGKPNSPRTTNPIHAPHRNTDSCVYQNCRDGNGTNQRPPTSTRIKRKENQMLKDLTKAKTLKEQMQDEDSRLDRQSQIVLCDIVEYAFRLQSEQTILTDYEHIVELRKILAQATPPKKDQIDWSTGLRYVEDYPTDGQDDRIFQI